MHVSRIIGSAHRSYEELRGFGEERTIIDRPSSERIPLLSKVASLLHPNHSTDTNEGAEGDKEVVPVRIIDRDGCFNQSKGKVVIQRKIPRGDFIALYSTDWFHSLLDAPTYRIIILLTLNYMAFTLIFALLFYLTSVIYRSCSLDIDNFHEAFVFSLETMATLGYGTSDIFFGDCVLPAFILALQVVVSVFVNAVIIGVIYHRVSRPQTRASTIVFSNKAVIRRIRGKLYFMFQLCELRQNQLVEAHIRLYSVKNEVDPNIHLNFDPAVAILTNGNGSGNNSRNQQQNGNRLNEQSPNSDEFDNPYQHNGHGMENVTGYSPQSTSSNSQSADTGILPHHSRYIQTINMRLNHPNDELGGMLLLMMPQVVVHEIDMFSPLMPPSVWYENKTGKAVRWTPPIFNRMRHRLSSQTEKNLDKVDREVKPLEGVHKAEQDISKDRAQRQMKQSFYNIAKLSDIEYPNVIGRGTAAYPTYSSESLGRGSSVMSFASQTGRYQQDTRDSLKSSQNGIPRRTDSLDEVMEQPPKGPRQLQQLRELPVQTYHPEFESQQKLAVRKNSNSGDQLFTSAPLLANLTPNIREGNGSDDSPQGSKVTEAYRQQNSLPPAPRYEVDPDPSLELQSSSSDRQLQGQVGPVPSAQMSKKQNTTSSHGSHYYVNKLDTVDQQSQPDSVAEEQPNAPSTIAAEKTRLPSYVHTDDMEDEGEAYGQYYTSNEQMDTFQRRGAVSGSSVNLNEEVNWGLKGNSNVVQGGAGDLNKKVGDEVGRDQQHSAPQMKNTDKEVSGAQQPPTDKRPNQYHAGSSARLENAERDPELERYERNLQYKSPGMAQYCAAVNPRGKGVAVNKRLPARPAKVVDWQREEQDMIIRYLKDRSIEIIAVVEGLEPGTSANVQARYSYTDRDIEWNQYFFNCLAKDSKTGLTTINFSQFHELSGVPYDAPYGGAN